MVENPEAVKFNDNSATISVQEALVKNGYLEKNDKLTGTVTVTREPIGSESDSQGYTYTYEYGETETGGE